MQLIYEKLKQKTDRAGPQSSVGSTSDCGSKGHELEPQPGHITFMETDQKIKTVFSGNLCPHNPACRRIDDWSADKYLIFPMTLK